MKRKTIKRIFGYIKKYIPFVIISAVCALIYVAASLYAPVIIGDAIDLMVGKNEVNFAELAKLLGVVGVLTAVAALGQWCMNLVNSRLSFCVVRDLRNDIIKKLQKLPLKYLDKKQTGELISNMTNDAEAFSDGVLLGFTQLFSGVVTIVGTLIFMLIYNRIIAAIVVLVTPLSLIAAKFLATKTHKKVKEQAQLRSKQTEIIEEIIANQKTVQAYSYEEKATEKFDVINNKLQEVSAQAVFFASLTNPVTRFVNSVVYALVALSGGLCAAGIWTVGGGLSAGGLSCLLNYSNKYTKPFNEISGVITELQASLVGADRIFRLLDEEEEPTDGDLTISAKGEVTLSDVSFSYTEDKKLIEHLDLSVKSGQKIAIVGPTGCGKTTLVNLLMRFYDVTGGAIYVDGADIRQIKRNSLRDNYGMVLQESWLRKATVKENLRFGNANATDEEIVEAAKKCYADGFIRRLPNGYDTVITEDSLSQGEKQLLCITRVMLSNPTMLILDEATSSVDTRTEIKINQAFDMLMENKTAFVVAHRLSTIKSADKILVMKDGNVIETGTHKELLAQGGFYYELYYSRLEVNG